MIFLDEKLQFVKAVKLTLFHCRKTVIHFMLTACRSSLKQTPIIAEKGYVPLSPAGETGHAGS
jgi:hypothetical protein